MSNLTVEVVNQGQINRMLLPAGWHEVDPNVSEYFPGALRMFQPAQNRQARFSFLYRGRPIGLESAAAFRGVLEGDQRNLSQEEIDGIIDMLGNIANSDAFKLDAARVAELNGRRVLMVDGVWLVPDNRAVGVFIDADGTGSVVQEVHFVAPADEYAGYKPDIAQALDSIEWKKVR